MQIKMIGLGKMGLNIALNLKEHGHDVVGFAPSEQGRLFANEQGIATADSIVQLLENQPHPLVVWLLVPNQTVDSVMEEILPHLIKGDIVIDGGNSNYHLSVERNQKLKAKGIELMDVGTSGGTKGARHGACLMVGGNKQTFLFLEPVFKDISAPDGYAYMGEAGSGHFVKMVHNGIEYGMMQAIGEGFELMQKSPYPLDFKAISKVWNHGSIIQSSLIGNIESAFSKDACLQEIEGKVDDSGEGMWMIEEALKFKVSMPVISLALFARFKSRDELKFAEKVVAAMRNEFGGHATYKTKK